MGFLNTLTEEQMRLLCLKVGLSKELKEFCKLAFCDKLSAKELAEIYNIDEKSVNTKKYRLKKKLIDCIE